MIIQLHSIKIKDVYKGYINNLEEGVFGYSGKLNIRPAYQREFIYKPAQQESVIETILKNFPLNVMYWVDNGDSTYELMDGQQRTMSFCEFINNSFSILINNRHYYFNNLQKDQQDIILNYELQIYICEGTDTQKLEWFKIINVAGEKLTEQELRNAIYIGPWLTSAKKRFSKTNCVAYQLGKDFIIGSPIRQEYLEKTLYWISNNNIEQYMATHQHDINSDELFTYYQNVINWVNMIFPVIRKEMKGVDWGTLYNQYKDKSFDGTQNEEEVKKLIIDDDVQSMRGIYPFIITRNEKYLNIRKFSEQIKNAVYINQKKTCNYCKNRFEYSEMEGDHITPWSKGGKTIKENCQMLCVECNRRKGSK